MAQASSVPAREPSMEEILASIRRIIEDSDSPQNPAETSAEAAGPVQSEPVTEPEPADEIATTDVEAFRTELSAMDQETEPAQQPVTEEAPQAAAAPVYESRPQAAEPEFTPAPEPAPEPEPAAEQVSAEYEPPVRHEPAAAEPPQDVASARMSIISETAGRQVAAAFEELSDAFATNQRRSFDDVAEELLRPMLQDWLDNNLPVLVERLVREEIERVARGAAR
jgi:uncharacterized protein